MNPLDTGRAYDRITHLWDQTTFNNENGLAQHRRALQFVGGPGTALDVGCGCTGRFVELLLDEGFTVSGIDVSAKMVELAQARHPDVEFHQADICEWRLPTSYSFITAWDSIWHVPLGQQAGLLTKLVQGLTQDGVLIFSFGGTSQQGEHRDSAMGEEVYYSTLGVTGVLETIAAAGGRVRHFEYDQHPELHAYLIAQRA
ncbi:MAG: class I SAM-dependent methyltransferase [Pseudomonadota bacterium]